MYFNDPVGQNPIWKTRYALCITGITFCIRCVITGWPYLCKGERSSVSWSGSLVFGITPMMVLFNEVPFNKRLLTSCMFRGVLTLIRTVEPGNSTPSWVKSRGRRLGIWIPLLDIIGLQTNRWRELFKAYLNQRCRTSAWHSSHNKELRCLSKDTLFKRRQGKRATFFVFTEAYFFYWLLFTVNIDTQPIYESVSLLCNILNLFFLN